MINASLQLPPFGKFLDKLKAAGVHTETARGFWGGIAADGTIVVTSWTDATDGQNRFYILRPKANHGRLKKMWNEGKIRVGTEVSLILLRQRGSIPLGKPGRTIAEAALMPMRWQIVELTTTKKHGAAVIEPIPAF
jgi:hypothetical protein